MTGGTARRHSQRAKGRLAAATARSLVGRPHTFYLNSPHRIVKEVAGAVTLAELKAGPAMIDPRTK